MVSAGNGSKLEQRVVRAAEAALAQRKFVTAIDVLVGVGWLETRRVDEWRQGRVPYLERVVIASLGKISTAMQCFRRWAKTRGLEPSETAYVARTRDRRPLRFSKSGDPKIERAYRTHWVSPELSERKRARLTERQQALEPDAIELAVAAAVRHQDTRYDELLMSGLERAQARAEVRADLARVVDGWRRS